MSLFGRTDRRHFLAHAAGAATVAVPGLSFLTALRASAAQMRKQNKSLIVLWMGGGPSTIDIWDMKPGTANGGEHKPVNTAAGGVQITEHLPSVAKQMKHLSIVRSLTTTEGDHRRGTVLMSTGRTPNPLSEFPHVGSVLAYQYGQDAEAVKNMDLPAFVSVGENRVGPGFLGMKYAPFTVQNAGQPPENVEPPNSLGDGSRSPQEREVLKTARMARRAALFDALEGGFRTNMAGDAAQAHRDVYNKALQLVVSNRKDVFSLDKEPAAVREAYGNTAFGRGCLLARKLVEVGVACVEVGLGSWDNHTGIFNGLATRLLPSLDKGMAALVDDLDKRGRLKDTVILWMGEFGRTPRINQNAGRDHFPRVWSVVVGGGNLTGGTAYGSTNADGTDVKDKPVKVGDLFATVYAGLGLDPTAQIRDNLGRPQQIGGDKFTVIQDLVSGKV